MSSSIRLALAIMISVLLSACFFNQPTWEVGFGWKSGWGSSPTYKIDSKGILELTRPYPDSEKKICSERLDSKTLSKIWSKLNSIPSKIPKETKIEYLDNCFDERENYIFIIAGNSQQGFSYSQSEDCRRVEIPAWLVELNDELEMLKNTIEDCDVSNAHNK